MAFAKMKPPMNKKMIGLANGAKPSLTETTPNTTASTGSKK